MFHALVSQTVGLSFAIYPLIALGLAIEGDFLLFAVMLAVFEGVLDPAYAIIAAAIGAFFGDIAWYRLGVFIARNPEGKAARFVTKITAPLDDRLRRQPIRILLLSKLTYGLHRPILIRFGMLGMSQKKLMKADFPAVIAWVILVGVLAWLAHETLLPISSYLRYFELALLAAFIGFIAVQALIAAIAGRFIGTKGSANK